MQPSHWSDNYILINEVKHHYLRTGDGSKPPLVLVHGFSDNGLCWLQTALDLEDQYDIVMPDVRGHGLSARIIQGEPVDFAADLAGLLEALGLFQPIVGGHSMGARIAFDLGVRYPSLPKALLLEDPPWFESGPRPRSTKPDEHPMAPWLATIARSSLEELVAETRIEHPTWPESVIQTWCSAKKQLDLNFLAAMSDAGTSWAEGVPKLTCPTLIVTGDNDKGGLVSPALAARLPMLNAHCEVFHIPDTGHHIRFEAYAPYMQRVGRFFQEIG
jgi:pimeloyl-ACP methyl ester carboxylesterase